jgi:hypothetical protein
MAEIIKEEVIINIGDRKDTMNTTDKIINNLAIKFANEAIENANYKAYFEEAQAQLEQVQEQLARVNSVLDSDQALKDLFDEASKNLEEGK